MQSSTHFAPLTDAHQMTIFGEAWELRFGPDNRFRVFYRLDEQMNHVCVLAIDELESILLACSPRFQKLLERSNRQIDQGKGISHDEFWRRVEANP